MNIKYTVSKYLISTSTLITLNALVALTGTSSWGAAADQPITPASSAAVPITQMGERIANAMADAAQSGDTAKVNQLAPAAIAMNRSFDDLPDDVLELIAGLLDEKNLIKIAQVNRRWNQIATSMPLFQESFLRHFNGNLVKALFYAAINNYPWAINFLRKKGVDINIVADPGDIGINAGYGPRTALTLAIRSGHENVVAELLKNGALTDVAESGSATPLMVAASFDGTKSIVKQLIDAHADVNLSYTRQSPLVLAANHGYYDETDQSEQVMDLLIKAGANLNTALNEAIAEYPAAISLLIKHGADVSHLSSDRAHTAIQKIQSIQKEINQSRRYHWKPKQIARADQKIAQTQLAVDILTLAAATEDARAADAAAAPTDMPEQPREPGE